MFVKFNFVDSLTTKKLGKIFWYRIMKRDGKKEFIELYFLFIATRLYVVHARILLVKCDTSYMLSMCKLAKFHLTFKSVSCYGTIIRITYVYRFVYLYLMSVFFLFT